MQRRTFLKTMAAIGCATPLVKWQSGGTVSAQATEAAPLWSFTDEDLRGGFTTPIVADGVIYFGNYRNVTNGQVVAVKADTQEKLWVYTNGGGEGLPIAYADGTVYSGSKDGNLYAINAADGSERWVFALGDEVWIPPVVASGAVIVGGYAPPYFAVNVADGSKLREFSLGETRLSVSAAAGEVVYLGDFSNLYAFNVNDETTPLWQITPSTEPNSIVTSVSVVDDTVYVGDNYSHISAINAATGETKWSFLADSPVQDQEGVVVADGVAYFGTYEGVLYAVDVASGEQIWSHPFVSDDPTQRLYIDGKPAVADGVVCVNAGGTLVAFTSSGEELWRSAQFSVQGGPAVANGVVYIGGNELNLLAFTARP